ncbi:hypothetical protein [Oceanirhabdus sp. W0125-5]|uniref:hypothetical protein n=1 Tax=Oceanirhabdus sp. W0125-5 TaxID=2999116 RepID=UPI0022F2BE6C|nr:hypothetical protein [Oceanirhabdus sp. W0125-5]WBW98196.1 hypothetical protein OW730_05370 [Oceanirhabdus sp. W0125-5]
MSRNHDLSYDNLQTIHCDTFSTLLKKRQDTTNHLLDEITSIKNNIKKLIKNKDIVIKSISEDERVYLTKTINDLTISFEELDKLISSLQSITNNYDVQLNKYISMINDPNGNLDHNETKELLSQEDNITVCPNCSISFTYDSKTEKCPFCGSILKPSW